MAARKAKITRARPRKTPARARSAGRSAHRADYGKPIEGVLARQPAHLRAIADALRRMIEDVAPEAESSLKWGMPCFTIGDRTVASIGVHKAHVNLVLWGPEGTYVDPGGLLSREGKVGAHLRLTSADGIPRAAVRAWLRTAAQRARAGRGA
jgi:hypothetical protein